MPIAAGLSLFRPTVSVFDPDGQLPLNLQRTGLAVHDLPFQDQLLESQCEDFVAWTLVNAPTAPPIVRGDVDRKYPGASYEKPRLTFAFAAEGSVIVDSWTFQQMSPSKVIFFPSAGVLKLSLGTGELLVPLDLDGAGNDARKAWFRCSVGWNWRDTLKPFDILKASGCRTILRTSFYNVLRKRGTVAQFIWDRITIESSNKRWTILRTGSCPSGRIDFEALLDSPEDAEIDGLTEHFQHSGTADSKTRDSIKPSVLAALWRRVAGEVVIPYDLDQRQQRFREAYEKLRAMIEYYESVKHAKSE